jgi:hypothetical protein
VLATPGARPIKRDALLFNGELRRRRRLGSLAALPAGTETLDA